MAEFLDFHLIVNKVSGTGSSKFVTVVAEAPASRFGHPFGQFDLEKYAGLPLLFTRDAEQHFRLEQVSGQPPLSDRSVGQELFKLLFPQESAAKELLGQSCQLAGWQKYLRLKLELHPELSDLPWELMTPPKYERWAEQIRKARLSIIRYLGSISDMPTGALTHKQACIIVVKADPIDCAQHLVTESLAKEWNRLKHALDRLPEGIGHYLVEGERTLSQLVQLVNDFEEKGFPIIGLHFMGHGSIDNQGGFFAGEDDNRKIHRIYADDLRDALDRCRSMRWVILNACSTAADPIGCPLAGLATSLSLLNDIPTVIAYKRPVRTSDAETLAADFYERVLGKGSQIEEVIRTVQLKCSNPGGLVVMSRAVEGRIQDSIHFGTHTAQPQDLQKAVLASPSGATASLPNALTTASLPKAQERLDDQPRAERSTRPRDVTNLKPENGMILIPTGPFKRGLTQEQINYVLSQFQRSALDLDSARVTLAEEREETKELPAYYIDRTPVTNADFRCFVEATGHRTEAEIARERRNWRVHDSLEKADHPVVYVSFADAEAYCRWANKRLPTADEWKKAYRGSEGRLYPWGNSFDLKKCNTAESERGQETTSVNKFPNGASYYGCLDMVGNVEEWTATVESNMKMVLGGSWAMTCELYGLPVLHRLAPPRFYSNDLGFRCAKDL